MILLESQKDALFSLIERQGLSPSLFEIAEGESWYPSFPIATRIKYKGKQYFYSFETFPGNSHSAVFSPGSEVHTETKYSNDWGNQQGSFSNWITFLIRELNTPNRWTRLEQEIKAVKINVQQDDSKFTAQEYEEVQQRIETLKQGIATLGLPAEKAKIINAKLDHQCLLAKTMSKVDWTNLFVGTIINIIVALSLSQETGKAIWEMVKGAFSNYLMP